MIRILIDEDTGTVKAEGHAGHGSRGNDIVCAAVSTLMHMLGAEALKKSGGLAEDTGDAVEIRGYGLRYMCVLKAVAEELKEIEGKYTESLKVIIKT